MLSNYFTLRHVVFSHYPTLLLYLTPFSASLREALYRGGIAPETLEVPITSNRKGQPFLTHSQILIRGDTAPKSRPDTGADYGGTTNSGASFSGCPQVDSVNPSHSTNPGYEHSTDSGWPLKHQFGAGHLKNRTGFYNRQYSFGQDDSSFLSEPEKEDQWVPVPKTDKPQYSRIEQRTILIKNISDRTTHKDIVDIIRGGPVLDIFLRPSERSANVSFLEGSAAQGFMSYVRRNDIYVHGKRVGISSLLSTDVSLTRMPSSNSLGTNANLSYLDMLRTKLV